LHFKLKTKLAFQNLQQ